MSRATLLDTAHDRVKDLDWEPDYVFGEARYPTRYKIPKKTKDPFKHLVRQYCAMEREKDDRVYGSVSDVCTRTRSVAKVEERWGEAMKLMLTAVPVAEYAVQKSMALLIEAVDNAELRQGYLAQMMDEQRHYSQEYYLARYFAKYWKDPHGFAMGIKHKSQNLFFRPFRAGFVDTMVNGDPIMACLGHPLIAETAYTNPLFVAVTELAAANGDDVTPSVFLSIQSDEVRHMANGYATLSALLTEPDNLPILQEDLDDLWWQTSRFFDPFLGVIYDYFPKVRGSKSWAEYWDEWIWEDFGGSYMARLEPFGLRPPATFGQSRDNVRVAQHQAAMFAYAAWPLQFFRFDVPTPADFEWLEGKYPGYWDENSAFWEMYEAMADPAEGAAVLGVLGSIGRLPTLCRMCQMPAIFPKISEPTERIVKKGDRWEAFCSVECERIFDKAPHRYMGYTPFFERYDGWDLADIVIDQGLVRADGKTLVGQPRLDTERMWTVEDLRRCEVTIEDPVRLYVEEMEAESEEV